MKTVKIFIASSIVEFEAERDKLAARIRGLNDKYRDNNIYFQLDLCEDYSHAETPRRKQEEFNKLIRQCDFFFALIGADAGKATLEEIEVAREQFRKSGSALSPKIVVFFRDLPMEALSAEVIQLKMKSRGVMGGQYPPKFTHVSEITEGILWELIDAGAFFDPSALEQGRRTHAELVARIKENWRKIAALGEPTADNELELALLYQENVELSREALSEREPFYAYALFLHKRGQDVKAIETGSELEALYTSDDDPGDRADLQQLLGDCRAVLGRYEDAERYYRAALELYRALPDDSAPELADTCFKLAKVMVTTYRFEAAERLYREALTRYLHDWEEYASEIGQTCHAVRGLLTRAWAEEADILRTAEEAFLSYWADEAQEAPDAAREDLSHWLEAFPCPDTAAELMREAEATARDTTQDKPEDYEQTLALICDDTGRWLYDHNQMEHAEAFTRRMLEICQKLADKYNTYMFDVVSFPCMFLGVILANTNRPDEAERRYQEALNIKRRLAEQDPAQFELDLAEPYFNLATLFHKTGRYEEAEQYYRKALEIYQKRAKQDSAQFEPNLASYYNNLAVLLGKTRRYQEAEQYCKEALDIRRRLVEQDPAQFEPDLALSCHNLAVLLGKTRRYQEAEQYYKEALDIRRRLAEQDPAQFEPDLASSCHNYGLLLLYNKHDPVAALAYFDEAVSLLEKYPHFKAKLDNAIQARSICKQEIWARHGQ